MSNYWWWLILSELTGSPVTALILLVVGGWALDQFTLGILPSPLRLYRRWRRAGELADLLSINPHDRRARFELADLLCDRRQFQRALAILKPNVESGETDVGTMYLMGRAAFGSGHNAQAETFLGEAIEQDPEHRMGASFLELGRGRLAGGDYGPARTALEDFCKRRPSTVEGRVLLARACLALGAESEAARLRQEAWREYATSPRFVKRQERWWAWRLRPWRPVILLLGALSIGYGLLHAVAQLRPPARRAPVMSVDNGP